jgi:hypothetical protein
MESNSAQVSAAGTPLGTPLGLANGQLRLFWPRDLEEISPPQEAWWRFLLGGNAADWIRL